MVEMIINNKNQKPLHPLVGTAIGTPSGNEIMTLQMFQIEKSQLHIHKSVEPLMNNNKQLITRRVGLIHHLQQISQI